MSLQIASSQIVYNAGNVYYFTKTLYNSSDIFYIYTNYSTLINIDKIIIYNTLTRNISNILTSDVVNNIYLYRQFKDDRFAIFKRDIAQETADKIAAARLGTPIITPSSMITSLRRVDGGILNPQRLLLTESPGGTIVGINLLDPSFSI
jgi:hypothetical protein